MKKILLKTFGGLCAGLVYCIMCVQTMWLWRRHPSEGIKTCKTDVRERTKELYQKIVQGE